MMHKEFTILEDIVVHSVPDGIRTTLAKGKTGIISQSLGDNYTIVVEGNMYQLNGIDGEKIGEEKRELSLTTLLMKKKFGMFYILVMILKFL